MTAIQITLARTDMDADEAVEWAMGILGTPAEVIGELVESVLARCSDRLDDASTAALLAIVEHHLPNLRHLMDCQGDALAEAQGRARAH